MDYREEIIEYFVKIGKQVFSNEEKYDFPKENVMFWLWGQTQEEGAELSDMEKRSIIAEVHAHANSTLYKKNYEHYLTAGDLKKRLESVSDNTPVYYQTTLDGEAEKYPQNIEKIVGDTHEIQESELHHYENLTDVKVVRQDGKIFVKDLYDHVPVFAAFKSINKDDKKVFVLTAYY